ncbi:superoxide dismutase [Fe], chloroplastic isoform X2 [Cryptomeria japonica]|uniref:superoxide dismutase [Fe], chloroplastic isoform X2 n=1 Tax=Cryptomeria japonica TaxID=3369 RepID=UPI0027D9DFA0|nr:superoxide dismutase [Fe], chloroplastic isoform X2 [Cryptomeria japonica]
MMTLLQKPCFIQHMPLHTSISSTKMKGAVRKTWTNLLTVAQFGLKDPPYKLDALEPYISHRSLEVHWGKHHRGYLDNLNKQIEGTTLQGYTLEELIKVTYNNGNPMPAFSNAAQLILSRDLVTLLIWIHNSLLKMIWKRHKRFGTDMETQLKDWKQVWNHDFFWECMEPGGGKECTGEILEFIERDFKSYDMFLEEFKQAAATQFGSGWVWLVVKDRKLAVEKSTNAVNPLVWGHMPLLTLDVWEIYRFEVLTKNKIALKGVFLNCYTFMVTESTGRLHISIHG